MIAGPEEDRCIDKRLEERLTGGCIDAEAALGLGNGQLQRRHLEEIVFDSHHEVFDPLPPGAPRKVISHATTVEQLVCRGSLSNWRASSE